LIVLNKSDELSEPEKLQVTVGIQALNPHSEVIMTSYSKVGQKQISKLVARKKDVAEASHVKENLNLTSFVYQFNTAIQQTDFENFLKHLPDSMYRIKGFVKFTHSALPYLFQYSYGMPLYMQEEMNLPLNLVFIGEEIKWDELRNQLRQLEKKDQ
jgi:G3E family GTPase